MMTNESELEATCRLLANEAVDPGALLHPHIQATFDRISEVESVLVVHDTTHFNFGGAVQRKGLGANNGQGQGFGAHVALAIRPGEDRTPLGVCSLERVNRTVRKGQASKTSRELKLEDDKESFRWQRAVEHVQNELPEKVEAVHVMDREPDIYDLLANMCEHGDRFVVRAAHDRAGSSLAPQLWDDAADQVAVTGSLARRAPEHL